MSLYSKMQTTTEPDEPFTSTDPEPSTSAFTANKGWFEIFKKRIGIHNVKITGEERYADHAAATAFPSSFQKIIEARGYKPEQVFNVDVTGLYWKKMPEWTFIAKEEKKSTRVQGSQRSMHIDSLLQCYWTYDKNRFHLQVAKSTCTKAPE